MTRFGFLCLAKWQLAFEHVTFQLCCTTLTHWATLSNVCNTLTKWVILPNWNAKCCSEETYFFKKLRTNLFITFWIKVYDSIVLLSSAKLTHSFQASCLRQKRTKAKLIQTKQYKYWTYLGPRPLYKPNQPSTFLIWPAKSKQI